MSDMNSLLWAAYSELSAIRHGRPMSDVFEVDQLLGRLQKAAESRAGSGLFAAGVEAAAEKFSAVIDSQGARWRAEGKLTLQLFELDSLRGEATAAARALLPAGKETDDDPNHKHLSIPLTMGGESGESYRGLESECPICRRQSGVVAAGYQSAEYAQSKPTPSITDIEAARAVMERFVDDEYLATQLGLEDAIASAMAAARIRGYEQCREDAVKVAGKYKVPTEDVSGLLTTLQAQHNTAMSIVSDINHLIPNPKESE